jgi:hypothetical protein
MRTPFIDISFIKSKNNYIGLNSYLYSTLNGFNRLLRIFAIVKYKILIIIGSFSPILDKLKTETVIKTKVYPKNSAVERGVSSKTEILIIDAVRPTFYRSSVFIKFISCSL